MTCYAVDRIEGRFAILEGPNGMITLPRGRFREGQVYCVSRAGRLVRNRTEENRRRREVGAILEQLKRTDPGGNISL